MSFDIEKAKRKNLSPKVIQVMEKINENNRRKDSCKFHEFEHEETRFVCKNCKCEVDINYYLGYTDAIKHLNNKKEI